jgi:hypothetical protein
VSGDRFGEGAAAPGAGSTVSGTGATVPLSAEGLHPAGQSLRLLRELGVGWCVNARERRPGDGLGYSVGTAGRGVKLDIRLGGESDLNVPGWLAGPDSAQEVVWHVREASEVSQVLGRLTIPHCLGREELAEALLFGGGQPVRNLV